MSIRRQLISYINSGKCFALIGSGLSASMGYPSWKQMAIDAANLIPLHDPERATLEDLIERKDFPEVFERVGSYFGDVSHLLAGLRSSFNSRKPTGQAYEYVCKWPFRCYLTTNYDDEIDNHLQRLGEHFTPVGNTRPEMAGITSDSQRRIVKIHGDLVSPRDIVLTTSQYTDFETGGNRSYFRSKLISIFQMVPVVVIGHSITDMDLQLTLKWAKESASPDKPTYVLVANAATADVDKMLREFNIHLVSYPNAENGNHANLIQLLRQIDRFVIPRTSSPQPPLDFTESQEAVTAVSLYVHSSLRFGGDTTLIQRAIQPQILAQAVQTKPFLEKVSIGGRLSPATVGRNPNIISEIEGALQVLANDGMIRVDNGSVTATVEGENWLREVTSQREAEENQFYGSLHSRLRNHGTKSDIDVLIEGFKVALLDVFRRRGLAAAEMLFRESGYEPPDMPELFESVFPHAAKVKDFSLRAEYCDAVMNILTNPNNEQRRYLSNIAQGFFSYHMFGIDPTGTAIRKQLLSGTAWLLDSNVLIPLLAEHCTGYRFMQDLLSKLRKHGIASITTPLLVSEADRAFGWMQRQLVRNPEGSEREALLGVIQRPTYGDNPFVDSYIKGCALGDWSCLAEYKQQIGYVEGVGLRQAIEAQGIQIIEPATSVDILEVENKERIEGEIFAERDRAGTIRGGDVQVRAESEALLLIRRIRRHSLDGDGAVMRAFFVSTSRLFDKLFSETDGVLTWFPDLLYRHLCYLDGDVIDAEAVFQAITSTYYTSGVSVIDEANYAKYFKPSVTEANATLNREIQKYVKALDTDASQQQQHEDQIRDRFARTPDLEKPLYVSQLGWLAARAAEQRLEAAEKARALAEQARAEADRKRVTEVDSIKREYERKERDRKTHEANRLRNLQDPKHLQKRMRQAKNRKRKNR